MTVATREFALDLASTLSTARGTIERRQGLLIGITDGDVRGVGEATPLPGWTESFDACHRALVRASSPSVVDVGDLPAARHGLALAHADAAARRRRSSLAAFLADGGAWPTIDAPERSETGRPFDGSVATSVPVNATVGDAPPAATATAARQSVRDGFDCVKLKVGRASPADDLRRLRAVRDAVGESVALRADANGAWAFEQAARFVDGAADVGVEYVEQPLPAADLAGHARLRGRGVEIAVDESLAHHPLEVALSAEAADVVVLKPMALGGPDRTLTAAVRARESGVEPVVTTTVDAAPARAAAVHVAAAIPDVRHCGLATGDLLADDVAPDPVPVVDGAVAVPDGPGSAGTAFDTLLWGSADS
jgi:o-succinylbenzoate synthase